MLPQHRGGNSTASTLQGSPPDSALGLCPWGGEVTGGRSLGETRLAWGELRAISSLQLPWIPFRRPCQAGHSLGQQPGGWVESSGSPASA